MGDTTAISWTDHTFNPWWGCTKIAPGCDNCYAAAFDARTGGNHWETGAPRRTSPANWRKPILWNRQAEAAGRRHRVFCGSMMDWCDGNAPEGALTDLWDLIRLTPMLDWQLLTKRSTLIRRRLPEDWGWGYDNVWLGVTAEDRAYGLRRIFDLADIPAVVHFVSAEPLLEPLCGIDLSGINWVIIGGESGVGCRPMDPMWAYNLIDDCRRFNVPVWFKQWGGKSRDKGGSMVNGREIKEWPGLDKISENVPWCQP